MNSPSRASIPNASTGSSSADLIAEITAKGKSTLKRTPRPEPTVMMYTEKGMVPVTTSPLSTAVSPTYSTATPTTTTTTTTTTTDISTSSNNNYNNNSTVTSITTTTTTTRSSSNIKLNDTKTNPITNFSPSVSANSSHVITASTPIATITNNTSEAPTPVPAAAPQPLPKAKVGNGHYEDTVTSTSLRRQKFLESHKNNSLIEIEEEVSVNEKAISPTHTGDSNQEERETNKKQTEASSKEIKSTVDRKTFHSGNSWESKLLPSGRKLPTLNGKISTFWQMGGQRSFELPKKKHNILSRISQEIIEIPSDDNKSNETKQKKIDDSDVKTYLKQLSVGLNGKIKETTLVSPQTNNGIKRNVKESRLGRPETFKSLRGRLKESSLSSETSTESRYTKSLGISENRFSLQSSFSSETSTESKNFSRSMDSYERRLIKQSSMSSEASTDSRSIRFADVSDDVMVKDYSISSEMSLDSKHFKYDDSETSAGNETDESESDYAYNGGVYDRCSGRRIGPVVNEIKYKAESLKKETYNFTKSLVNFNQGLYVEDADDDYDDCYYYSDYDNRNYIEERNKTMRNHMLEFNICKQPIEHPLKTRQFRSLVDRRHIQVGTNFRDYGQTRYKNLPRKSHYETFIN